MIFRFFLKANLVVHVLTVIFPIRPANRVCVMTAVSRTAVATSNTRY